MYEIASKLPAKERSHKALNKKDLRREARLFYFPRNLGSNLSKLFSSLVSYFGTHKEDETNSQILAWNSTAPHFPVQSTCPPQLMGKFQNVFLWAAGSIGRASARTVPRQNPTPPPGNAARDATSPPPELRKEPKRPTDPSSGAKKKQPEGAGTSARVRGSPWRERIDLDNDILEVSSSSADTCPSKRQRAGEGQTSPSTETSHAWLG